MMSLTRFAILFSFLALIGCTRFWGIKPVYPEVGDPTWPAVVESLRPTFEWQGQPDVKSYDFIIYDVLRTEGTTPTAGRVIYYREALESTKHQVEDPLKPDTEYYWSVRTRDGSKVSPWSRYNYMLFLVVGAISYNNHLFTFKTPKTGA